MSPSADLGPDVRIELHVGMREDGGRSRPAGSDEGGAATANGR
jgi:hypothetical protein